MEHIQMTVTVEQAQVIAEATDLFARLSIGQIGMIAEMVSMEKIPRYAQNGQPKRQVTAEVCDAVRKKVEGILNDMGYSGFGHSLGVGNEHVPVAGHRAYEVSRVLKKTLAEHREPAPIYRGVDYDGLVIRYTKDPIPKAVVVDKTHS